MPLGVEKGGGVGVGFASPHAARVIVARIARRR
jgi:hypothetical protein